MSIKIILRCQWFYSTSFSTPCIPFPLVLPAPFPWHLNSLLLAPNLPCQLSATTFLIRIAPLNKLNKKIIFMILFCRFLADFAERMGTAVKKEGKIKSVPMLPGEQQVLVPHTLAARSVMRQHIPLLCVILFAGCSSSVSVGQEVCTDAETGCGLSSARGGDGFVMYHQDSNNQRTDRREATVLMRVRSGGCYNRQDGEAKRIDIGFTLSLRACAAEVLANPRCSLHFEYDMREFQHGAEQGYCGCGGLGGNECKGADFSGGNSAEAGLHSIYRIFSYDKSARLPISVGASEKRGIVSYAAWAKKATTESTNEDGARLHLLPSGMLFATTRGYRVAAVFERGILELQRQTALESPEAVKTLRQKLNHIAVTYACQFCDGATPTGTGRKLSFVGIPERISVIVQLVHKLTTDYIDDKQVFGRLARQAGVEGTVVPRTFASTAEAIKVLTADPAASEVVFIKPIGGAGGKAVRCMRVADLHSVQIGKHDIIQEGATNFALLRERKWTIRAYVVIHNGRLYVSRHFNGFKHATPYNPSAVDLDEQHISNGHTEAHRKATSFETAGGRLVGPSDFDDNGTAWTEAVINAVKRMAPMFGKITAATKHDPYRYLVLGIDAIPRLGGDVQIIEVNPYPNLSAFEDQSPDFGNPDQKTCEMYTREKVRLLASVFRLIFGMQTEASSSELVDVSA